MAQGRNYFLSTTDNKFNYFTDFDNWYKFDRDMGYNCCSRVARVADTNPYFPDEINDMLIDIAVDSIVDLQIPMIGADGELVFFMRCFEPSTDQTSAESD